MRGVRYIPCPLRAVGAPLPSVRDAWRIRLVAYGARLESVLGASPRGFESPILRHRTPGPLQVPGFSRAWGRSLGVQAGVIGHYVLLEG